MAVPAVHEYQIFQFFFQGGVALSFPDRRSTCLKRPTTERDFRQTGAPLPDCGIDTNVVNKFAIHRFDCQLRVDKVRPVLPRRHPVTQKTKSGRRKFCTQI